MPDDAPIVRTGDTARNAHMQQPRLSPAQKSAIIAAVATGRSKSSVAKQFNIHRNTVTALCKPVQALAHPANPLAKDYRASLQAKAVTAVESGLDCDRDAYKRAGIGVRVLEGLGEFEQKQEGNNTIIIKWKDDLSPDDVWISVVERVEI